MNWLNSGRRYFAGPKQADALNYRCRRDPLNFNKANFSLLELK